MAINEQGGGGGGGGGGEGRGEGGGRVCVCVWGGEGGHDVRVFEDKTLKR